MILERTRGEPVAAQALALIAFYLATHFGLHVGPMGETVINVAALLIGAAITRKFTSPAKPVPPAAGPSAKEQPTMNLEEFEAAAKTAVSKAIDAGNAFFTAHPEITSDAAKALQGELGNLATLATTEVAQQAPAATQATLDAAIDAIDAEAESKVAAIQTAADQQKAALQSAKAVVAQ